MGVWMCVLACFTLSLPPSLSLSLALALALVLSLSLFFGLALSLSLVFSLSVSLSVSRAPSGSLSHSLLTCRCKSGQVFWKKRQWVATDPSDAMRACAGYRGGQPRSGGLGFERAGCPSNITPTSQRTTRWRSNVPRKTSWIFRLPTLERRPCADTSSYALHVCSWEDFFGPCTTSIRRRIACHRLCCTRLRHGLEAQRGRNVLGGEGRRARDWQGEMRKIVESPPPCDLGKV